MNKQWIGPAVYVTTGLMVILALISVIFNNLPKTIQGQRRHPGHMQMPDQFMNYTTTTAPVGYTGWLFMGNIYVDHEHYVWVSTDSELHEPPADDSPYYHAQVTKCDGPHGIHFQISFKAEDALKDPWTPREYCYVNYPVTQITLN